MFENCFTMAFTLKTILDERYKNAHGCFSLKLRLTHNRKSTYISVKNKEEENVYLTKEEWEHYSSNHSDKIWQSLRESISRAELLLREKYYESVDKNIPLKNLLKTKAKAHKILTIFDYTEQMVEYHRKRNAHSTADSYENAMASLKKYFGTSELYPSQITVEFMKEFEKYLKQKGNSQTTIAIYQRNIRATYNYIIDLHPKMGEFYPFSRSRSERRKVRIKNGNGKKGDALSIGDLKLFIDYKPPIKSSKSLAHRIWVFSFYCHGMNFKDIALLKYKNINRKNNTICYIRSKTIETETHLEELEVPITPRLQSIIDEFRSNYKSEESLIFPLVAPEDEGRILNRKIKNKIGFINKWLKRICKDLEIPQMTTYWARHTFATIVQNELDESLSFISQLLGHSSEKTTQGYTKPRELAKKFDLATKIESMLSKETKRLI